MNVRMRVDTVDCGFGLSCSKNGESERERKAREGGTEEKEVN